MSSRLPQISAAAVVVGEMVQQLTNQRAAIEEDILSSFEDLHKQLDVRKSVLLMELEVTFGLKHKVNEMKQSILGNHTVKWFWNWGGGAVSLCCPVLTPGATVSAGKPPAGRGRCVVCLHPYRGSLVDGGVRW